MNFVSIILLEYDEKKFSTSFSQVVKTIMMLGLLGQKRQVGKSLLRDIHSKDCGLDLIDKKLGLIKEQNVKLS